MKKIYFLLLLISTICSAQIINIPDANFKARLLSANEVNNYACFGNNLNNCIYGIIDINGNGEIEVSEVENIVFLHLSAANISDLTGIEYFINLESINCAFNPNLASIDLLALTSLKKLQVRNNQLTSLDLTGLNQLEEVSCQNNQLTSLDISEQSQLKLLLCEGNQINSLDFSNNPALQRVYCGNNQLTTLDFGANPQLFDLGCRNSPNLTSINIKNGMINLFGAGTLYNQCWNNLPNLNYICADDNEIPALQSFLVGCGVTQNVTIDSACPLSVAEFDKDSFVIAPNPSNGVFELIFEKETPEDLTYEVYDILGKKLFKDYFKKGGKSSFLTLENYPQGIYLLRVKVGDSIINKKLIKK